MLVLHKTADELSAFKHMRYRNAVLTNFVTLYKLHMRREGLRKSIAYGWLVFKYMQLQQITKQNCFFRAAREGN